jgi:hypothetical protein
MYYIFKLSENWSTVDEQTNKSRVLDKNQVEVLCSIFPKLTSQAGLLMAVEVKMVPANKLMKLSLPAASLAPDKSLEPIRNTS